MKRLAATIACAALATAAHAEAPAVPPQAATCNLPMLASLDAATTPEGMIALPGAVDGHAGGFLLDTGGLAGVLGFATAKQLKAPIQPSPVSGVFIGGTKLDFGVSAERFDFGPLSFRNVWFLVAPDRMMDPGLIGGLQPHAITDTDFEIDFVKGKVNLFGPSPCPGHDAYWTSGAFAKVPMDVDLPGHINVEAVLDGKKVNVLIDTGAQNSSMSLKAASHVFGIDEKNPALKKLGDISVNNVVSASTYRYPFATLTFEGIEVRNPNILILDTGSDSRDAELIVGIGVLRQLHLYIAYGEKTLYLTGAEAN